MDIVKSCRKGTKIFRFPEECGMIEGSRQEEDQIKRLIVNKQIEDKKVI